MKRTTHAPQTAWRTLSIWLVCCVSACAPKAPALDPGDEISAGETAQAASFSTSTAPQPRPSRWHAVTGSQPLGAPSSEDQVLLGSCQGVDQGLMRAAAAMAEHQARTGALPDNDQVVFELRVAGVAQVWPRVWALVGEASPEHAKQGVEQWLASFNDGGMRRCGLGRAQSPNGPVLVVVALDAIADLTEVPRRARVGQWIAVRAPLLAPATKAEVVVLGPRGGPRSVPASLSNGVVGAQVVVDQPGPWLIQVLPSLQSGPRPAAEAMVFVQDDPPEEFQSKPVPGEHAADKSTSASDALLAMLNAARASERLGALRRNPQLEVAAMAHAKAMLDAGRVAHNLGDGDPAQRVASRGLVLSITGENVARAESLVRAHRALWGSPSHRGNMLLNRFTDVGIGVAEVGGVVWVCEVFGAF
jgi:uncharacterized protein YkwD